MPVAQRSRVADGARPAARSRLDADAPGSRVDEFRRRQRRRLRCHLPPDSMQRQLKHAAVQIAKLDLPYPLAIVRCCASRSEARDDAGNQIKDRQLSLCDDWPVRTQQPAGGLPAAASAVDATLIADWIACSAWIPMTGPSSMKMPGWRVAKKAIARAGPAAWACGLRRSSAQSWLKQAMAEDELDASRRPGPGAECQAAGDDGAAQHRLQVRRCRPP